MSWKRKAGAEWARKNPTGSAVLGIVIAGFFTFYCVLNHFYVAAVFLGFYLIYCIYCLIRSLK